MEVRPISGYTRLSGIGHFGYYSEFKKDASGRHVPEAGSRALGHDFLNMGELNGPDALPWYEYMDRTREAYGNDVKYGNKQTLYYKQYVVSPDPRDECSLEQLRDVTMEWVRTWFSDFQVAVVYHDDNESCVKHAHVIVNNTNLTNGHRLGSYLRKDLTRRINQSAQQIALEHGLRGFDEHHESRTGDEMRGAGTRVADDRDVGRRRSTRSTGGSHSRRAGRQTDTRTEREARARGEKPWKDDIRECINVALDVAATESEFIDCLAGLGVRVTVSRQHRANEAPEWVFHHPEWETHRGRMVRGARLGVAFSRRNLDVIFALNVVEIRQVATSATVPRVPPDPRTRRNIISGMSVVSTGTRTGRVTLDEVSQMLSFNRDNGIRCYDDYRALKTPESIRAERVAREIGAFDVSNDAATAKARMDMDVVDEYLRRRDESGAGGFEATGDRAERQEESAREPGAPVVHGGTRQR